MRKLIITDLTRFKEGNNDVCMAAIDIENGECIRPLLKHKSDPNKTRYLTQIECKESNILPGSIIMGNFEKLTTLDPPHNEDCYWHNVALNGHCTSDEFLGVLQRSKQDSVASGFGVALANQQKHIDVSEAKKIKSSIITLEIPVGSLEVMKNTYDPRKININFSDNTGAQFRNLSITDFGFFNHIIAKSKNLDSALFEVNAFIQAQQTVYIRLGLSRCYEVKERRGFWMQVNGIYTFPNFYPEIRSYK